MINTIAAEALTRRLLSGNFLFEMKKKKGELVIYKVTWIDLQDFPPLALQQTLKKISALCRQHLQNVIYFIMNMFLSLWKFC